ncbi:uncharacterized protein LOC141823021 [Curcuma longa]|uniref:uncharacterized protein LOC141823021 n=1 Tax=Curcuma longa TaxID=136217 RepID=UPI003D9EE50A
MARSTLFPDQAQLPTTHRQVFAIFLAVAWMATAVAVFLSLCATCIRKSSSKKTSSSSLTSLPANKSIAKSKPAERENRPPQAAPEVEAPAMAMEQAEKDQDVTVIPVEAAAATHGPIPPAVLPTSTSSKRKLSLSFGKVLSEKLRTSRKERKGEGEDTIWKKTIILGEKCKVSSDDDDDEEVVDEKGNPQPYYRPRTPTSRSTSRNNSFANPDEAPQGS